MRIQKAQIHTDTSPELCEISQTAGTEWILSVLSVLFEKKNHKFTLEDKINADLPILMRCFVILFGEITASKLFKLLIV